MSASSISVTAAAIATSSTSLSPTCSNHLSIRFLPCKLNAIKPTPSFKSCAKCAPFYSLSRSSIYCAPAAFDSVGLNQEENDEEEILENTFEEAVPEIEYENENDVSRPADAGRLYVGNLPFSMTSAQLSEILAEAGRVVSAEIVYDRVTDRSRGFAFVTMSSVEEAQEAIRLFDGAQIGGRTAKVNFPEVPRGGEREVMGPKIRRSNQSFVDSPYKIYAGNLSWSLTSEGLRETFAGQPGFLSAKVIYDRDSGKSRGYGFITFSTSEEVESAINAMDGVEVEGRPLRLNMSEQRPSVSPVQNTSENSKELSSVIN